MYLFRVDSRAYNVGDSISPAVQFENELEDEKAELEDLLNRLRPNNVPSRGDCLFLFSELAGSLRFFAKYGGNIYKVRPNRCYFRGDMNLLDSALDLFRFTEDEDLRTAAVNKYWQNGSHTFSPCYEILVDSAIVDSIVLDNEQLNNVRAQLREYGNCIEKCPTYINLLSRELNSRCR